MNRMMAAVAAFLAASGAARAQVPTEGLLSHWSFDEAAGSAALDDGPAMNEGFIWQAVRVGNSPAIGAANSSCLQFDGVDDLIGVSDTSCGPVAENFTVSFWALPSGPQVMSSDTSSDFELVTGKRFAIAPADGGNLYGGNHAAIGVSVGTNGICVFDRVDDGVWTLASYGATLTTWVHVAVVVTNRIPVIHLNGIPVRTGRVSPRVLHPSAKMGGLTGFTAGLYQGFLDDVRIYSRPLTEQELRDLAAASGAGPTPTPTPGPATGDAGADSGTSSGGACAAHGAGIDVLLVLLALLTAAIRPNSLK